MSEVINFRRAKKRITREKAAAQAAANRARFGRTKEERARDEAEAQRRERALDGHERSSDAGPRDEEP